MNKYQIHHQEISEQLQALLVKTKQNLCFIEVNCIEELSNLNIPDSHCELIFISNNDSLIFELLIFQPLYFIRTAHLEEDIQKLNTVLMHQDPQPILLKCGSAIVNILPSSIIYIESQAHYLFFHTISSVYKSRAKLSDYEEKLNSAFIRIHQSYLVNKSEIEVIETEQIILKNSHQKLPIRRNYRNNLKRAGLV